MNWTDELCTRLNSYWETLADSNVFINDVS